MDPETPDSSATCRLLGEIQAGDPRAFEKLFARHRAELRQFIELRLDPRLQARLDASDVVQETHLEVFQRLPEYLERQPMPFGLWLRKTAYERLLRARRRHVDFQKRSVGREVGLPDRSSLMLARQLVSAGETPSQVVQRREMVRRVRQALTQLSELDREVLLMRNYEQLSYKEIGYLLEIDPANARKRHGRALLQLHKLLGEGDPGLKGSEP